MKKNIEETKAHRSVPRRRWHGRQGATEWVSEKGVEQEKDVVQIGRSFNEVAEYGARYGVRRLPRSPRSRNRRTAAYPLSILDVADNRNTVAGWNCVRTTSTARASSTTQTGRGSDWHGAYSRPAKRRLSPGSRSFWAAEGANFWLTLLKTVRPDDIVEARCTKTEKSGTVWLGSGDLVRGAGF